MKLQITIMSDGQELTGISESELTANEHEKRLAALLPFGFTAQVQAVDGSAFAVAMAPVHPQYGTEPPMMKPIETTVYRAGEPPQKG